MKIQKVHIPAEMASKSGLKAIKMDKLNQVVLIAGKNGAGKSRLLSLLKEYISNMPNEKETQELNTNIIGFEKNVKSFQNVIEVTEKKLKLQLSEVERESLNFSIAQNKSNINAYNQNIETWKNKLNSLQYISIIPSKINQGVIMFVPKSIVLEDGYKISDERMGDHAKKIFTMGTDKIHEGTIPAIYKIQRSYVNVKYNDDDLNVSEEDRIKIIKDYERLRNYIKLFLNTELQRDKEGQPTLFGRRIGEKHLSDGQIILLQFCLALYAQETQLENLIIFMDEPENHLHPEALIEVLDKIVPHIKNGQLWIATHSINVLAHFDPSSIWYIDKGELSYAGNVPRKVLEGLLGNEEEIEKLSHFLSLPAQMASTKFAFESLFYPKVLLTGTDDPQVAQINEIIQKRKETGERLCVLDYGIGKGRLLSTIYENERIVGNNLAEWLDFYGYDKYDSNKDLCLKVFEDVYGTSHNRYFNKPQEVSINLDEKSLDFIVMCNVFHEIDPMEWITLFQSNIFKLLKDDGYLLIVEDQFLAMGEKAHSKGFLVFDTSEFKTLFKMAAHEIRINDYRRDGRLKAHYIPKSCISRIDKDSRVEALKILRDNAKIEIRRLRSFVEATFKEGKLHGFWSQQLTNASLALEDLGS